MPLIKRDMKREHPQPRPVCRRSLVVMSRLVRIVARCPMALQADGRWDAERPLRKAVSCYRRSDALL